MGGGGRGGDEGVRGGRRKELEVWYAVMGWRLCGGVDGLCGSSETGVIERCVRGTCLVLSTHLCYERMPTYCKSSLR